MHLQEILIWPDKALPSTSCNLCNCKVWSCYGQWLMRCITKKIHYLTLTPRSRRSRSNKMLTSTLDFMWPMHQQSLMLLHPMEKEKIHLKENILFDLGVKVTQNVAQYPRHHVTYAPAHFDIATSHCWGEDAFTRKYIKWPWSWYFRPSLSYHLSLWSLLYPLFSLKKKGILISCQKRSVCLSLRLSVRTSVRHVSFKCISS